MTSQHINRTSQHMDSTSRHNYPSVDGRNMPPYEISLWGRLLLNLFAMYLIYISTIWVVNLSPFKLRATNVCFLPLLGAIPYCPVIILSWKCSIVNSRQMTADTGRILNSWYINIWRNIKVVWNTNIILV